VVINHLFLLLDRFCLFVWVKSSSVHGRRKSCPLLLRWRSQFPHPIATLEDSWKATTSAIAIAIALFFLTRARLLYCIVLVGPNFSLLYFWHYQTLAADPLPVEQPIDLPTRILVQY
jgi:hypothetical protein